MLKKFIFIFTCLFCFSTFAISDEQIIKECRDAGIRKVKSQSEAWNCELIGEVEPNSVDNRWYNPVSYVWYHAPVKCKGKMKYLKDVQVLVRHVLNNYEINENFDNKHRGRFLMLHRKKLQLDHPKLAENLPDRD